MEMKRTVLRAALSFAILFSLSPAIAEGPAIEQPGAIANSFNVDIVKALFEEVGFETDVRKSREGLPVLLVTMPGGAKFVSSLTVCDQLTKTDCLGMHLIAYFNPLTQGSPSPANLRNARQPFAKIYTTSASNVAVARYIIADGGITKANVYYNLTNFIAEAQRFANTLEKPSTENTEKPAEETGPASELPIHNEVKSDEQALTLVDELDEDLVSSLINVSDEASAWLFDDTQ